MEKKEFNFTEAFKEIEQINEWFQQGDIDLDEALRKYKRGMELIEQCKKRLKQAENKFKEIKKQTE